MSQLRAAIATAGAGCLLTAASFAFPTASRGARSLSATAPATAAFQRALDALVSMPSGPPGVIAVIQRGSKSVVYRAGTAERGRSHPPAAGDHVRIASVSKAFSGAVALSLVSRGELRLSSTIGEVLPRFPRAWRCVTLRQMLQHRSGLPDYISSKGFQRALARSPHRTFAPIALLRFVWDDPLQFRPGSRYKYDDSDNLVIAMMARAAAHRGYRALLRRLVLRPARLRQTSLPLTWRMPRPYLHGYLRSAGRPPLDVSEALSASAAWASGGIVSTAADANAFVRAYLAPRFFPAWLQAAQLRFVPGVSGPPGPGRNGAGLGIFRYRTRCGTVYGHTGNGPGYTTLVAASGDASDSLAMTATEQLNPQSHPEVFAALRRVEALAVCAALGR